MAFGRRWFFQENTSFFLKKYYPSGLCKPLNKRYFHEFTGAGGVGRSPRPISWPVLARPTSTRPVRAGPQGRIRRVCLGVYDYPRQSELLGQALSPDIDQVAQALARKFNWRIPASGDAALNLLGLLHAGAGKMGLPFRRPEPRVRDRRAGIGLSQSRLEGHGFALRESGLLVPAIKALGKEHVDAAVVETLRQWLDPKLRAPAARYAHGGGLDLRNHQAGL
jgi:hypothetical protein